MSYIRRIGVIQVGKNGLTKSFKQFLGKNVSKHLSTDAATKNSTTGGVAATFDTKDENEILEKLKFSFDSDSIAGNIVPVYKRALLYGNNTAIKDEISEYSYTQLYMGAKKLSMQISNLCGKLTPFLAIYL